MAKYLKNSTMILIVLLSTLTWFECPVLCSTAGKNLDLKFETLALGHSGILVSWDPSKEPNQSNVKYHFYYQRLGNTTQRRRQDTYSTSNVDEGQVKIANLAENSEYQIIIERREKRELSTEYMVKAKTEAKTDTKPAKPDFKYITKVQYDDMLVAVIIWLPCGKDRNCKGLTAGTHFIVNYKVKKEKQFAEIPYQVADRFRIKDLFPGKTYEIKVISVNGLSKTESDPQELIIPPTTGPVQSVKVLPLGNAAFLLTWKAPQDSKNPIKDYRIKYGESTGDLLDENNFFRSVVSDSTQAKISKLSLNRNYTIYIIPRTELGSGTEYQIDVTTKINTGKSLPLAKPEVTYKIIEEKFSLPRIRIYWFPCGKSEECKNTRPGTAFHVKYKSGNSPYYNTIGEFEKDYVDIYDAIPNEKYELTVSSIDKSEFINSDKVNIHIPQSDSSVNVVEAVEGKAILLTCKLPRSAKSDIQWKLNGSPVEPEKSIFTLENGNLKISDPKINMRKFTCSDKSQSNGAISTIFLTVKSPTIIENKKDFGIRQLSLHEKVNLTCQIRKEDFIGVDVKWLKDGKDQGGDVRDPLLPFQVLKVLVLSLDTDQQFGNYTCVAKSHLDEDRASVSLVKKK